MSKLFNKLKWIRSQKRRTGNTNAAQKGTTETNFVFILFFFCSKRLCGVPNGNIASEPREFIYVGICFRGHVEAFNPPSRLIKSKARPKLCHELCTPHSHTHTHTHVQPHKNTHIPTHSHTFPAEVSAQKIINISSLKA